jgi:hypothetical protein
LPLSPDAFDQPAGSEFVALLRDSVGRLVALDCAVGGDQAAVVAVRLFREVQRCLARGFFVPSAGGELLGAAAELAEVTAWLLFDAERQDAAWRLNREALRLARLGGDRRIEMLTRHNVGLQAEWHRRPGQALWVADAMKGQVACERSPRLSAVVRIRETRALAQMGRRGEALRALELARSLFYEGASARDPDWTWWLDRGELSYHEGQVRADLGNWGVAADHLARAVEECPPSRPRDRLLYRGYLLEALVRAGAEQEMVSVMEALTGAVGDIGSSRTASVIRRAAVAVGSSKRGAGARDLGLELERRLPASR